ncbi:toxin-antitoxin system antitoxin component Xre family [Acholeplasma sp. CAG:878]|nr:toxin-antitoxin system antitoxin component Xre family [Acholeplasma sp. CAG:878]
MQNNLKQIRNNKNLLQTKVAMDLNITQETISSYETGRVFPSSDMLIKLADYYNTSIDYILCRTKYDMPIDSIKPNNITDEDFMLLNKIHKLSSVDKAKAEAYIDGLND